MSRKKIDPATDKPESNENRQDENQQEALSIDQGRVDSPDVSASGDEETIDGLNERDEGVRESVEDVPGGTRKRREVPVFDRGDQ